MTDLVDTVLVRIDRLRDRPIVSMAAMALLGTMVAAAWWFGRPGPVVPIEELIPLAGTTRGADDVAAVESDQDSGGAGVEAGFGIEAQADHTPDPGAEQTRAEPGFTGGSPGAGRPDAGISDGVVADLAEDRLIVHVSGEVETEGLVELASGARIADAISAAGGPTAGADIHRLNLAAAVADGMHIRVPAHGADSSQPLIETAPGPTAHDPAQTHGADGRSVVTTNPVNLNRADATELETLPGIGPALAQAIIRWRTDNGGFAAVDDLLLVPGIGPAKLAALTELVAT